MTVEQPRDQVEQTFRGVKYHHPRFGTAKYLKIEFSPRGIMAALPEDLRGEFWTRYELALDAARASGTLDELDEVMSEWFIRASGFHHLGPDWEEKHAEHVAKLEKLAEDSEEFEARTRFDPQIGYHILFTDDDDYAELLCREAAGEETRLLKTAPDDDVDGVA